MRKLLSLIIVLCLLGLWSCNKETELPNIVYILADDMGYGDISALNPDSKIDTPNIDNLADEGMIFTDAHSGSAVCSPTRYGILTGRYAWRSRLKSGVCWSWDPPLIEEGRETVASILRKQGYSTACIGKWHLGLGWTMDASGYANFSKNIDAGPNDNGFDYSFIIPASLDIPPYVYIENHILSAQPNRMTESKSKFGWWRLGHTGSDFRHDEVLEKFTNKSIEWLNKQAADNKEPFFLYLPLAAPHTPILPAEEFIGVSNTNAYGDFVVMVDHMVGKITETLNNLGLSENTIVVVTSDNGCSPEADFAELAKAGHDPSFVFRGHKADIFEGGHRVPFIVRWPSKVKAASSSDQLLCLTDFIATIADITGQPLSQNCAEDSYSFYNSLLNKKGSKRKSIIHHSVSGLFAIRTGNWKLAVCPGSGGWSFPTDNKAREMGLQDIQLYNLANEIEERENLAYKNKEIVDKLYMLLEQDISRGRSTPGENQKNTAAKNWPDKYLGKK